MFKGALWLADLYGIEVRGVGRQVDELAAPLLDQLSNPRAIVRREIVHPHHLPRPKRRRCPSTTEA